KSGNAVILRGGKEAAHSSRAIVEILSEALAEVGLPADAVQLVETPDRDAVGHFLRLDQYIALAIPRGGEGLIRRVGAAAGTAVGPVHQAIEHINRYGSHHADAIVTGDLAAAREFARRVDSSAVMINASTRFNDGGEFGLGAEIGISTDKLHARGPCGLKELTSYKYVVYGEGQVK